MDDVRIDIIGGFLGAGKTTFINKLLAEGLCAAKVALIENEFGDESIDSELVEMPGFDMRTLASGCICCTLKLDFISSISELVNQVRPRRILIEPTGLAGPRELEETCASSILQERLEVAARVNSMTTIVNAEDAAEMVEYEIPVYLAQLEQARFIVLSRTQELDDATLAEARSAIESVAPQGVAILDTPWSQLDALEVLGLSEAAYELHANADEPSRKADQGRGGHHAHGHAGFSSGILRPSKSLDPEALEALTQTLCSCGILRAKGFVPLAGEALCHYEFVNGHVDTSETSYAGPAKLAVIGHKDKVESALQQLSSL